MGEKIKKQQKRIIATIVIGLTIFLFLMGSVGYTATIESIKTPLKKPAILVVSGYSLNYFIDPTYREKIEVSGYHMASCLFKNLTWKILKQFNVVVIIRTPYTSQKIDTQYYESALPLLNRFLKHGGGILALCDAAYGQTIPTLNMLLKPLGAQVLEDNISDHNPTDRFQQKLYRQQWFITTTQIAPSSITQGITEIAVPGYPYNTHPVVTSNKWKVLITGDKSAYSVNPFTNKETYKTTPPMFAVRKIGKGRIAVFPLMSTWSVQAGYFRIWQGIVLNKGHVFKLLKNTYNWLAEPSLKSGVFGGYSGPGFSKKQPQPNNYKIYPMIMQKAHLNVYKGIIGVHAALTGNKNTVPQFCYAARKLGLNYLVFTEPLSQMNAIKWEKLVSECRQASWGHFVAIPGISYRDTSGFRYIGFDIPTWINHYYLNTKQNQVTNTSGMLFSLNWPAIAYVESHKGPNPSLLYYHENKFYTDFGLFTYNHNKLIDNSVNRYKVLTEDEYWLRPLTYNKIYSIRQMESAAKNNIYHTYVLAPSIKEVPQAFLKRFAGRPFGNNTFVSNGPIIKDFNLIGNGWTIDPWETYYIWKPGQKAKLYINVESKHKLSNVIIYNGFHKYYNFQPYKRHFKVVLEYPFTNSGYLWMEVKNIAGQKAYSYSLMIRNNTWWSDMCADLQNTLQGGVFPIKNPGSNAFLFRNKYRVGYGGMGGQVIGWSPNQISPINSGPIIPEGLDAIEGGFSYQDSPSIFINHTYESLVAPRLSFLLATRDVSILKSYYYSYVNTGKEGKYFIGRTKEIAYPNWPNGYNVVEIEPKITFRKNTFIDSPGKTRLSFIWTGLSGNTSLFPDYTFLSASKGVITGQRKNLKQPIIATLAPYGYAGFYPEFWGSGGIFSLENKKYNVRINGNGIQIGWDFPAGTEFKKGQTLSGKFLIIRGSGHYPNLIHMVNMIRNFGVGAKSKYQLNLTHGKVITIDFSPLLQDKNHYIQGSILPCNLTNPLLLRISPLNINWTADIINEQTHQIRPIGIYGNTGYVTVNTKPGIKFWIGHPLICSNKNIRIVIINIKNGYIKAYIQNPTTKTIQCTISLNKASGFKMHNPYKLYIKSGNLIKITI